MLPMRDVPCTDCLMHLQLSNARAWYATKEDYS